MPVGPSSYRVWPSITMRPVVGGWIRLIASSSVLLPEPLGPSSATSSPASTVKARGLERLHGQLAVAEGLRDVVDLDDRHAQPPSASCAGVRSACHTAIRLASTPPTSITAKVTAVSGATKARVRGKPGAIRSRST